MPLLDELESPSEHLTATEGVIGVASWAVASNGQIAPEQLRGITTMLGRMRLFEELKHEDVKLGFATVLEIAREDGLDAMLERSAHAVPADVRDTTFAIASDLVLRDGEFSGTEQAGLERIREALGVPQELAEQIVEVMEIKNRG